MRLPQKAEPASACSGEGLAYACRPPPARSCPSCLVPYDLIFTLPLLDLNLLYPYISHGIQATSGLSFIPHLLPQLASSFSHWPCAMLPLLLSALSILINLLLHFLLEVQCV